MRGASGGLTTTGAARYSQDTPGIPGTSENNDVFGSQIRLADFNRDGKADLAVSAPEGRGGTGLATCGARCGTTPVEGAPLGCFSGQV
ncbi:FG-GAP repeat protein [Streptomyces avermitilis]|uniref:FG-GAP repeat protein n=1 Tax=Streptomyces avermitilis TaxID=33903 RepID=UPI0033A1E0D1